MTHKYAFCVAGTHSGCGKTTITLALIAALKNRGFRVQPFKVGPDFIDPGFHTQIAGCESRNLDGWMLTRDYNRRLFHTLLEESDTAVVEGVMGLFDGYDGISESGSTGEMAKWLDIPVVLIVDARSMARSAAALVQGFVHFDPDIRIAGVVFNRIAGAGHLEYLREAVQSNVPQVSLLGGIPREEAIGIPERHLGLVTADEIRLNPEWKGRIAGIVEEYIDLDLLLEKVRCRPMSDPLPADSADEGKAAATVPRSHEFLDMPGFYEGSTREAESLASIAVARDAAFCFYYRDNFELLERAGAQLEFFSPLAGEGIPEGAAGLYLGGGYPELFAERIASNRLFLDSLAEACSKGLPIYAECGGLMTLGRFIDTKEGQRYPMAGLLPFGTRMLKRRKALGYTEVVLRDSCLLGEKGAIIRGHEFHYSEIAEGEDFPGLLLAYGIRNRKEVSERHEGYMKGSILASYIHLHWGSNPGAAWSFVKHCRHAAMNHPVFSGCPRL